MVCGGQTPPEQKWKTILSSLLPAVPSPFSIHCSGSGRLVRHQILTALLEYPQWRQDRWNNLCSFPPFPFHLAKLLCCVWVWSRHDADIQIFHKTNHLLNTRASTMQRNLPSVTHCSFHLSTFFRFLTAEFLSNPNVLFLSTFPPNDLFAILCHLPVPNFQSTFSTFPMIFSSKIGKMASSSRTSSNTTPQSNSSLTFLK